jgi:hypothetical protein
MNIIILLILSILSYSIAASHTVVTSDGILRSVQVNDYIKKLKITKNLSITSIINCNNNNANNNNIINNIFNTKFNDVNNAISIDITEYGAVLYTSFDDMFSSKLCGSKATDFCSDISNSFIITSTSIDIDEILNSYDQVIRRLFNKIYRENIPVRSITVLLSDSTPTDFDQISKKVEKTFEKIWTEVSEQQYSKLLEKVNVEVVLTSDNESSKESVQSIIERILASSESYDPSSLGQKLTDAWKKSGSGTPKAILSPAQRESLLTIELAYTACIELIEAATTQWRQRIGSGKVVGKFGVRAQELLERIQKTFFEKTRGSLMIRERADRSQQLTSAIQAASLGIFRQQLSIAQTKCTADFKKELIALAAADNDSVQTEEQQLLRKAVFSFRSMATELEVDSLGLSATAAVEEFSNSLQTIATEFPESPAAKLEAVRKMEKQSKKGKKKGSRAVNIGLNLVGMLRPPGYGNLQGFVGYATSLLGLPLDLMLGVQNDGDSPEVMGEDREYPLLRIQPKVHFDIDV